MLRANRATVPPLHVAGANPGAMRRKIDEEGRDLKMINRYVIVSMMLASALSLTP